MAFSPRRAAARVVSPFHRHQRYIWSWMDVTSRMPAVAWPEEFELVRATAADLPLLDQMDAAFAEAPDFLAAGHRLWLVRSGDRVVFSAWTFHGQSPFDAARTGWIALPEGAANQEDSNTHRDFRGRGVAGIASAAIAQELARDLGVRRAVTVILEDNAASRRAAAKSGWRDFAVVDVRKVGFLRKDADWRARRGDGPLVLSRVRVDRPDVPGGLTAVEEELFDWMRSAVPQGVARPAPAGAAAEVLEIAAAR